MKILIVEDEISLASALEHILREDGHFTDMVNDGLSALEYIYGFSYDLILLDVMLPRMDGFEVVRQIREKKDQYACTDLNRPDSHPGQGSRAELWGG